MEIEHQRCYIYSPAEESDRPAKRQRTGQSSPDAALSKRLQTFRQLWQKQESLVQATLEEADSATQRNIIDFISASKDDALDHRAIPAGLIVAGPSIASHGPFFERLGRRIEKETRSSYLVLTSGESPNLKTLLKNLIKKATSRAENEDEDEESGRPTSTRNGPKILDFDLAHLHDWQEKNQASNIIVAIQDSEAFDAVVLVELIELLYSWSDRIPFILLFGIATSAESFEDRLSAKLPRYLDGQKFDVTQSDEIIERLFAATIAGYDTPLRMGSNLCRRILDRQKDHVQNVQEFSNGLKYAYMSHLYASPPSIFLSEELPFAQVPPSALEAVRIVPSFRRWVELLLKDRKTQEVRDLLDSDEHLFNRTQEHVKAGQKKLNAISDAIRIVSSIRDSLQMSPRVTLASLWIRAANGELIDSPLLRETMLSAKKVSSDKIGRILASLATLSSQGRCPIDMAFYEQGFAQLISNNTDSTPLRTQHDVRNESLRTTVVAQKVLLSKHKAALSEQDRAYSDLVGKFNDELEQYLKQTLIDPREMFLSEILLYDLKSPHTEVFQPKPRFAIERALASPHDYLGCECCGGDAALSATQPPTSILYQLYLESGSLINVSDLWQAFNAIVGGGEEDEEREVHTKALFQRGLAELKHLGMVRSSRKKTDHVAKMMWKGL
ncbi:origin recognition complex subunit [Aaosphaeria arxii CBS 175.79]|uniref:Origin recognition complex subunit n=1 Tax=Aaosphaeria arxii CBS 175.79 TaxID=1450172 RepID=A0A6A5XK85_9PLEO|nr:origin recognition complex subunit [Aaosphaeria arxii CBS 175.79]KAF2013289.1 origin recognition complex subunit [Aaosphaeria arxii CBS 175.79]